MAVSNNRAKARDFKANPLTQAELRSLLHYDAKTGIFTWREDRWRGKHGTQRYKKAGDVAGRRHHSGYLIICFDWMNFSAHRLAWFYVHGRWPERDIDHRNGIKDDNRLLNLREANDAQQMWNMGIKSTNTSGYKGVSFSKRDGRWRATIQQHYKKKSLGYFDSPEEAASVYQSAVKSLRGEFARF